MFIYHSYDCEECDITGVQRGDQHFHRSPDDTALTAGSLAHLAWLLEHASDRATLSDPDTRDTLLVKQV